MHGVKQLACPPSLDAKMNVFQKLDNWGKHALRNLTASGPLDAPVTTWTLVAPSEHELGEWLDAFAQVLAPAATPPFGTNTPPTGSGGYAPIGSAPRGRTPVMALHAAEEVM